jgi:hypothetical protein
MAVGYQPCDDLGDEVEIHFDTAVANFDDLCLTTNTIAALYFGGIDQNSGWVSNLAWVGFWKDGEFFQIAGERPPRIDSPAGTVTTQPSKKRRESRQHIRQPNDQSLALPDP